MGKATIVSHLGAGQYEIDYLYDDSLQQQRITDLTAQEAALTTAITDTQTVLNGLDSQKNALDSELDSAISAGEEISKLNEITKKITDLNKQRFPVITTLKTLKLKKDSAQKEIAYLQAKTFSSVRMNAWCADFRTDLTGDVSTIEIDGDPNKGVLIYPGGCIGIYSAYQSMFGILKTSLGVTPTNCFVNRALYPSWQKHKPRHRIGTITAKTNGLCDVDLDPALSREQSLNINQSSTLTAVPIDYGCCGDEAFNVGDRVVIEFIFNDWNDPAIIGFESQPVACETSLVTNTVGNGYWYLGYSGARWSAYVYALPDTVFTLMNVNWRGRYVDGKPTLHLAWAGNNGRYFHTPEQAQDPNGPPINEYPNRFINVYKNGIAYANAPVNVLGAAIQDVSGTDYLYIIGTDYSVHRTEAVDVPDITTRTWTSVGTISMPALTDDPNWRNDWLFNGDGTEAVSVQYDALNTLDGDVRQVYRFKASINDMSISLTQYPVQQIIWAGATHPVVKSGSIGFALDYKDSTMVEAVVTWNTSSNTNDRDYEAIISIPGMPPITHLKESISNADGATYYENKVGILYMDLRYETVVSLVTEQFGDQAAGVQTPKLRIQKGSDITEKDYVDINGGTFVLGLFVPAKKRSHDEPGNIYLMRDIPGTQQYCDIDAATTVGGGTAVSLKMTWFNDPRVSLLQSGTDPNLIMGSPNFYSIGTLR